MSVVLYLSNQQIQAVVGTAGAKNISVQQAYTATAPEGSIINGIVMDPDAFSEFLKEFWGANKLPNKDVTVVINSTKFVGKTIELPKLKEKQGLEFIEREFASTKREEDDIYSYIPLSNINSKLKRVYAESVSEEFIREYMDIFKSAGLNVKNIYSGESSLISLTHITTATKYKTFLVIFAENATLTMVLWVDGSFYYFNSSRSFNQQGTPDYANDVARSASQIIQFMQANQIESQLELVKLVGLPSSDIGLYRDALAQMGIDVPMEPYNSKAISTTGVDVQRFLNGASGLVENGKYHNVLNQFSSKKNKSSSESEGMRIGLIIGIVFAVMLIATIATYVVSLIRKNALTQLEDEINSPVVQSQIAEYDTLVVRNSFLSSQYNAIEDIDENIASYPVCNNDVLKVFDSCASNLAEVEFESFDADEGIVKINATSDTVDNINLFIRNLLAEDIFKDVNYTGYSFDSQTDLWDIHVTCTLVEAAGRKEVQP
jgi:Tfp pilus assembly PilM family ATPase